MKKSIFIFATAAMIFTSIISCKDAEEKEADEFLETNEVEAVSENAISENSSKELEETDLVPSGSYTGKAIVVDAQQKELYVKLNDTTTIELYFNNETVVLRDGQQVGFDALQEGQTVEVEVERSGESLNPQTVRILENE